MYRMIIVDDNPAERNGIARTIDWAGMGLEVVGTYANGKQALEAIDEVNPDIILSDISMPIMNGIEMVEQLKRLGKARKTIFMSCHDEFHLAQSAVALDVEIYLLKPIIASELQEAVRKAITKHEYELTRNEERAEMLKLLEQSRPSLIDRFLRQMLFEPALPAEEIARKLAFLRIPCSTARKLHVLSVVIGQDGPGNPEDDVREAYMKAFSVRKWIQDHSREAFALYTVQIAENELALVVLAADESVSALDFAVDMKEHLLERGNIQTAWGISQGSAAGFGEAAALYKQSRHAVKSGIYSDKYPIVLYEEIAGQQLFEYRVDLKELYKEIKDLLLEGNPAAIESFFDRYLPIGSAGYAERYIQSFVHAVTNMLQIQLLDMNESFGSVFGNEMAVWSKASEFESVNEVRNWLHDVFAAVSRYLQTDRKAEYSRLVEEIKQIVKARYQEPLTVNEIAKSIYSSVSHANNAFKKVTGKTIFDYLIEHRMEAAKLLLRDSSARIYAVAEQVGYANKSHFCLLFKKYSGQSPQEFKSKAAGKTR